MMRVLGIMLRKAIANRTRMIFLEGFLFLLKLGLFFVTYTYAVQVGSMWIGILASVVAVTFFINKPISHFTWGYAQESKVVSKLQRESFERLRQEHERLINTDDENELIDRVRRTRASSAHTRPLSAVIHETDTPTQEHKSSIEMSERTPVLTSFSA